MAGSVSEAALDDVRPAVVAIMEDNFNFLTKMCTAQRRRDALAMIGAARARGCRVVVNGPDSADQAGALSRCRRRCRASGRRRSSVAGDRRVVA